MTDTIIIPSVEDINDMLNEAMREGRPQELEVAGRRFAVAVDYDHDGWHVATDMDMPEGTHVWSWDAPRGYVPILDDLSGKEVIAEYLRKVPGGMARRRQLIREHLFDQLTDEELEKEMQEADERMFDALRDYGPDGAAEELEDFLLDWVSDPASEEDMVLLERVLNAAGVKHVLEYGAGFSQGESYYALVPGDPETERPFARYLIQAARGEVYGVKVMALGDDGEVDDEASVWGLVGDDFVANDGVEFVIWTITGWLK